MFAVANGVLALDVVLVVVFVAAVVVVVVLVGENSGQITANKAATSLSRRHVRTA